MSIKFRTIMRAAILPSELKGFTEAFQMAFSGPPYNETYTPDEVMKTIWQPHLDNGLIILALDENQAVGFGCTIPLTKAPDDVRGFLDERLDAGELPQDFVFKKAWYMSELGVIEGYREQGLAYELVRHRMMTISHAGGIHYVVRTAAVDSNSRHLYGRIGARVLTTEQDVSDTAQVQVNGSQSTMRVYLYGRLDEATEEINKRILERGK